jgi:drug/metabolite transporter (DMT)-like permease
MKPTHLNAIIVALAVTVLWSSSWVLIKWGLADLPPLPFAGLRYALAALILLPVIFTKKNRRALSLCRRRDIGLLVGYGILQYALTQGCMYIALTYLPAISVSLLLSFSPVLVGLMAAAFLGERLGLSDWVGIVIYLAGAALYFGPDAFSAGQSIGLAVGALALLFNAGQSLLGRKVNRDTGLTSSLITSVSMLAGATALLTTGVMVQGWPQMSLDGWLIIAWLGVVNTAFAFWVWNWSQSVLTALDSSLINNTMLIQIAILGVVFLHERLDALQVVGLVLAGGGVLAVQLMRIRKARLGKAGQNVSALR